jgi:hypothetical protein
MSRMTTSKSVGNRCRRSNATCPCSACIVSWPRPANFRTANLLLMLLSSTCVGHSVRTVHYAQRSAQRTTRIETRPALRMETRCISF